MKKAVIALLVGVLALATATGAIAEHKPGHPAKGAGAQGKGKGKGKQSAKTKKAKKKQAAEKVTICHRTMSETNPHVTIKVARQAWDHAHSKHGDQMGACNGEAEPKGTTAATSTLAAVAGATGTGSFHVDVRLGTNSARVCYTLMVTGVDATAAHIDTTAAQTIGGVNYAAGAIVVSLKTPNAQGKARGCTTVSLAIGQALKASPGSFFVNVHSAAFPNGQVQGTLTAV
jgi:hypothetical protein